MWPTKKPEVPVVEEGSDAQKPPEKTPAELIAEAIKPLVEAQTAANTALNARLDAIEAQTKKPEKKPDVQQPEIVSVLDDENVAFAQRNAPIMARTLEIEARLSKADVKAEYEAAGYGELWSQYAAEIDAAVDGAPLITNDGKVFRGDKAYIRNCVDMVLGRAARKANLRFDGKNKGFFLEPASSTSEQAARVEADGLTDNQRKVMQRMGIPLEQAKKIMGKLDFIH